MKSFRSLFLFFLLFSPIANALYACPFCAESLSKNNGSSGGGMILGIVITIFLFLGVLGTIVGLIIRSIRAGDKRIAQRRALLSQQNILQPDSTPSSI